MAKDLIKRHQEILGKLDEYGEVDVQELSKDFNVSLVTIRKDLKAIEEKGLLYKAHGKAYSKNPYVNEKSVGVKEKINAFQKDLIAKKASELVSPHEHIIVASGTTVNNLADYLIKIEPLTVMSASLKISSALCGNPAINVVQIGGHIRCSSGSVVGTLSEKTISGFSFTKLFLGVDGVDLSFGLTTTNAEEASLNQLMIKLSQEVIVLADSSKFGLRGFGKICDMEEVDIIVTDDKLDQETIKNCESLGIQVIIS